MVARRIELICGVLGGLLGLAALGTALFVPSTMICYGSAQATPVPGCHAINLLQAEGLGNLAFAITLFGGLSLGILLFTVFHVQSRRVLALVILWGCTVLLIGATALGLLSIGLLFVPADVLALVASSVGSVEAGSPTPVQV
jgi:hypothetical protein